MKLNESKFLAEIKKLAHNIIEEADSIESCDISRYADGIISICNIIDTDNCRLEIPFSNLNTSQQDNIRDINEGELFSKAKEEQNAD